MSVVVTVLGAWLALTVVALVGMSLLGRAGRAADDASAADAARVQIWQDGVALGIVAPHPLHEGELALCTTCAAKVPDVAAGEPCPTCGTAVLQSPRIITPVRQGVAQRGVRRAV